jgi:UDP-glucuronate 4-epimerase
MTILITGASGFVGLNIVEAALSRGEHVVALALDALPVPALQAFATLPGRLDTVTGDVLDATLVEDVFARFRPDRVVPAAALTPGAAQERERAGRTLAVNVLAVAGVLEAAARHGVSRVVYPSSASVYGANAFGPGLLDETATPPLPESVYAVTKFAGERLALRYRHLAGLDVVAARVGTVFGPWERDTGVRETLSPHWQILRLAAAGREIVLPGPGERDWVYARDIAAAILALLDRRGPEPPVVNLGPGSAWPMTAWCAGLAARRPGTRWRLAADPAEANVDYWTARDRAPLANRLLVEQVGYRPRFGLEAALDDYLAWQATLPA